MYKIFDKFTNRLAKIMLPHVNTDNIPTYDKTARQKLVNMDEQFIKWISEVDADESCNFQFQKRQDVYVFVRLYEERAVDITGFTKIENADSLTKTVGKEKHESCHIFHVETGKELKRKNKTIWV